MTLDTPQSRCYVGWYCKGLNVNFHQSRLSELPFLNIFTWLIRIINVINPYGSYIVLYSRINSHTNYDRDKHCSILRSLKPNNWYINVLVKNAFAFLVTMIQVPRSGRFSETQKTIFS